MVPAAGASAGVTNDQTQPASKEVKWPASQANGHISEEETTGEPVYCRDQGSPIQLLEGPGEPQEKDRWYVTIYSLREHSVSLAGCVHVHIWCNCVPAGSICSAGEMDSWQPHLSWAVRYGVVFWQSLMYIVNCLG